MAGRPPTFRMDTLSVQARAKAVADDVGLPFLPLPRETRRVLGSPEAFAVATATASVPHLGPPPMVYQMPSICTPFAGTPATCAGHEAAPGAALPADREVQPPEANSVAANEDKGPKPQEELRMDLAPQTELPPPPPPLPPPPPQQQQQQQQQQLSSAPAQTTAAPELQPADGVDYEGITLYSTPAAGGSSQHLGVGGMASAATGAASTAAQPHRPATEVPTAGAGGPASAGGRDDGAAGAEGPPRVRFCCHYLGFGAQHQPQRLLVDGNCKFLPRAVIGLMALGIYVVQGLLFF
jgi:hypothetical protein